MKKLSVSFIIAVLVLLLGLSGCNEEAAVSAGDDSDDEVSIGEIKLVSAEEEYAPYENWIYALDKNNLAADGMWLQPDEVAAELEAIPVLDNAYIVIEGQTTGRQTYTLYSEQYKELYCKTEFTMPDKPGTYILCVQVA